MFKYKSLWKGLAAAFCPSKTGPTGTRLINFGRGGDGVLTNMDAATDWVRSQGSYCLDFDGVNDYVNTNFSPSSLSRFTISLWCIFDSLGPDTIDTSTFLGNISGGASNRFYFISDTNGIFRVGIGGGSQATTTAVFSTGQLYHIAITWNGATCRMYINAIQQTTTTSGTLTTNFPTYGIGIGCLLGSTNSPYVGGGSDNHYFDGTLDDIRIYNRVLSPSEIKTLSLRRGIAFEQVKPTMLIEDDITLYPQPTARAASSDFAFGYQSRKLFRKSAICKRDALRPNLWEGCIAAWAPCITGPTGLKVWDFARNATGIIQSSTMTWDMDNGQYSLDNYNGSSNVGNTRVLCGDGAQYNFSATSFSVAGWCKYMSGTSAGRYFVSQHGTSKLMRLGCEATAGYATFQIQADNGSTVTVNGTSSLLDNNWHHLCAVSTTSGVYLYVDGVLQATGAAVSGSASFSTDGGEMTLGGYSNPSAANLWPGRFDDIRIYNRSLQPYEVLELSLSRGEAYKPRKAKAVPSFYLTFPSESYSGPEVYWKYVDKYPQLLEGRVASYCPSITGPTGLKLYDLTRNNIGTLTNMDAAGDWIKSEGKYALDFDGTNDYLSASTPTLANAKQLSLVFWVKRTAGQRVLIGWNRGSSYYRWGWFWQASGADANVLYPVFENGSPNGDSLGVQNYLGWVHGAFIFSNGVTTNYINGIEIAKIETGSSSVSSFPSAANIPTFEIGRHMASGSLFYGSAQFDDIAIYNRALTPAEISLLAQARGITYSKKLVYDTNYFSSSSDSYSYYRRLLLGVG